MDETTIHEFLRHIEALIDNAGVCVYLKLPEAGRLHDFAGRWDVPIKTVGDMQRYHRSDAKKLLGIAKDRLALQVANELEKMK